MRSIFKTMMWSNSSRRFVSQSPSERRTYGKVEPDTSMSVAQPTSSISSLSARLVMRLLCVSSPVWFSFDTDKRTTPKALLFKIPPPVLADSVQPGGGSL